MMKFIIKMIYFFMTIVTNLRMRILGMTNMIIKLMLMIMIDIVTAILII